VVHRLPEKYGGRLAHPLDDFIEAVTEGPNDEKIIEVLWSEVEAIVGKYGGSCCEFGPVGSDYAPFAELMGGGRE
jgi:hypothetical protein